MHRNHILTGNQRLAVLLSAAVIAVSGLTGCAKKAAEPTVAETAATTETAAEALAEESTEAESAADAASAEAEAAADTSITILYTNDIHSYIYNVITDKDKNEHPGLRLSNIKALADDLRAAGEPVVLVDAGDEVQGNIYGAFDEGKSVIEIMNAAGIQLATPGNHEFDYGMFRFFQIQEEAQYPFISCNFRSIRSKEIVLPAFEIFELGDKKVAFIGITTPETISSSTPVYFQDETGEYIYAIEGAGDPKDLYTSVQSAIDHAKKQADYVIALGHIGDTPEQKKNGISSEDIIANTIGLDGFIDGHAHVVMEENFVKDQEGNDVLLTQTGSYLDAVGMMEISPEGAFSAKLIREYERSDAQVGTLEQALFDQVNEEMGEKIAELPNTLYITNPEKEKQRLIRAREMNLGDLTADSVYWFFNEKKQLPCDVAIINGGGVRAQVESGDITYLTAKSVQPFGNQLCLVDVTGQQILDALELGANVIGLWDEEWDAPAENGGFLQVAGLRYTVDASVESSVQTDENGVFKSVDGDYRVKDVAVYNRETGEYDPLDRSKNYSIGGINYILRDSGNGMSMFDTSESILDYAGQDCDVLADYLKSFSGNGSFPQITTENSPLAAYENYQLDYEAPYGAGRITMENLKEHE